MDTYIVLNQAEVVQYADIVQGDLTFNIIVPKMPDLGDRRAWGFRHPARRVDPDGVEETAGIYFEIYNDLFKTRVRGPDQEVAEVTEEPEFMLAWVGKPVTFRIIWGAGIARFHVNGVEVSTLNFGDNTLTTEPMSIYMKNANADDLLVNYITCKDIQKFA